MDNKIGIIILNYNCSEYLDLALNSLVVAKSKIKFEVGILDNGSEDNELKNCVKICEKYFDGGLLKGFLILSEQNLGFSGGNNILIKKFLDDPSISHLCLLNSDVIVTNNWLDRLLETKAEVVGPVTNATGNEQTISIDYEISMKKNSFDTVNKFAEKRYSVYKNYTMKSDILYFFCTLFSRSVFEKIGLLDEQFFPGSFEDNDFCMRIQIANIDMVIARGCYIHHFGSGSFGKLDMPKRLNITNENRERFQKKWNTQWKDVSWKLLESCRQDLIYFETASSDKWAIKNISNAIKEIENMIDRWAEAIAFYQSNQYTQRILEENGSIEKNNIPLPYQFSYPSLELISGKQLLKLAWIKAIKKIKRKFHLNYYENKVIKKESNLNHWLDVLERSKLKPSVCVFAPMFTKENEKDGYIQRIRTIDTTVLDGYLRFYLMGDNIACEDIYIENVDKNHIFIKFNSFDSIQREKIFKLVKNCHCYYIHSLLRFMSDSVACEMCEIFNFPDIVSIWDVHGAVPEEYELNESELGYKMANEIEQLLYKKVQYIVCVNDAMKTHLNIKYGETPAKFIKLPIYNKMLKEIVDCSDEKKLQISEAPVIVYAGGLQKWQNIDLMQDIIESTMKVYRYKVFVSDPAEFYNLWGKRKKMINVQVGSKSYEEIGEEYKNCHYGFVLRDDIIVNRVACPTKIIEYIQYGIIPIYKTAYIGDFVSLGLNYVLYEDILNNNLPLEKERLKMANENYNVLNSLIEQYNIGLNELKECIKSSNFPKGGVE